MGFAALVLAGGPAAADPYVIRDGVREAQRLYRKHDYAGSVAACDQVLARHPDDPVALAVRGSSLIELGEYRRAMADHDASLALAPQSPGALTNACWSRALAGVELERAQAYCDQAVTAAPGPAAYDTRGFLHLRRGEYDLAIADYTAALGFGHRLASSFYGRGVARFRLGHRLNAQADLRAALRIDPRIAATFARRGVRPE
jgi:tetratricopeptide (TPR) repeat protein